MTPSPFISVIVPVYKAESYLKRCVDSILQQAQADFEVILIDDGSPDSSGLMCDAYAQADPRVHVIHQPNAGVSAARNAGLQQAQGTWITFVDADDYLLPGFFDAVRQSPADLLLQGWKSFGDYDDYTEPLPLGLIRTRREIDPFLARHLDTLFMRTPWGKFFKKSLIGPLRFDTHLIIGEDTSFFFAYLQKIASLHVVNDSAYMYLLRFNDRRRDMSPHDTVVQFRSLYASYRQLSIASPAFVKQIFFFYQSLCRHRNYRRQMYMWYDDPLVQQARREMQPVLTFREQYKYTWKHLLATLRKWCFARPQ